MKNIGDGDELRLASRSTSKVKTAPHKSSTDSRVSTAKEKGKAKVEPAGNEVIHSSDRHHSDEKETKGKVGCLERINLQKYNVSRGADPRVSKRKSTAKEKGKAKVEPAGNEVIHSSDRHHSDEKETKGKVGRLERIDLQKYNVSHVAGPRVNKRKSTAKEKGKAKAEPGNEVEPGVEQIINFQKYFDREITIGEKVKYILRDFGDLFRVFGKRKAGEYDGDRRLDRKVLAALSPHRDLINGKKAIYGLVPGVELNALFRYRAEMTLIGLHRHNQAGIDFMSVNAQKYRDNAGLANCSIDVKDNVSIAVSVVVVSDRPGHSEHGNEVRSNWIKYEGQGEGPSDQKASKGNLALIHSCHLNLFVRVVKWGNDTGHQFQYDGLYDVKGYEYDVKKNSRPEFRVYRFRLVRRPGGMP